jgi:hypothetical protein
VKGPPITVTCECGEVRSLPWGAEWQCETCGKRWNTGQIPAEQYQELIRVVRRYRLQALIFTAVMFAIFAPLIILVDVRLGFTGLIIFFAWAYLLRPRQRRKVAEAIRANSRWQLEPE